MSKFILQIVMGLVGVIPIVTGLLGLLGVRDPVYVAVGVPPIVLLDTNLRFHSGVWVGLGLALYWLIPTIERQTVMFRVIWGMIFIGGVGRVLSMMLLGWPPVAFVAFTAIEIAGAPLVVWWQSRVSKGEVRRVNDDPRITGLGCISPHRMGGTGDPPVPSGDSPLGMGVTPIHSVAKTNFAVLPISSGQWPDDTGGSPVPPHVGEKCRLVQNVAR